MLYECCIGDVSFLLVHEQHGNGKDSSRDACVYEQEPSLPLVLWAGCLPPTTSSWQAVLTDADW